MKTVYVDFMDASTARAYFHGSNLTAINAVVKNNAPAIPKSADVYTTVSGGETHTARYKFENGKAVRE